MLKRKQDVVVVDSSLVRYTANYGSNEIVTEQIRLGNFLQLPEKEDALKMILSL